MPILKISNKIVNNLKMASSWMTSGRIAGGPIASGRIASCRILQLPEQQRMPRSGRRASELLCDALGPLPDLGPVTEVPFQAVEYQERGPLRVA